MTTREELLERARERAEGSTTPEDWGEEIEVEEDGGVFVGRFRGHATDESRDPARAIYLFWDETRARRFLRHRYRLGVEMERARPAVGDRVAIFRGPDYETKDGNLGHAYGVETEPSTEPLPTEQPAGAASDDEMPF